LVSAFDQALEAVENEQDLDRLMASTLYCRIRSFKHQAEEAEAALAAEPPTAEKLLNFARRDAASAAAAGQWLATQTNPEWERLALRENLGFSPYDQTEFTAFLDTHRGQIGARHIQTVSLSDCAPTFSPVLKSGDYDWNRRNWIQGNLAENEFVVTYDDGPHAGYTREIMSQWRASGQPKPAFFWLSRNAQSLRAIVAEAKSQGFPIGCHSERHADLGNLAKASSAAGLNSVNREIFKAELRNVSAAEFPAWRERTLDREIVTASRTLEGIVRETDPAFRLKYFRLPYGSGVKNAKIGGRFESTDLDHFFWKIDSLDWQDKNSASVHQRVKKQMQAAKKGLILFHDIQAPTVKTTELLLKTFRETSWKPVSIQKMVP
jgi:peptidoglycan/xylan/chitin deacetylase (PgdA/CDA1 family)